MAARKIGYVLKVFPRLSETFILNEILELERQGVEIEIFVLRAPTEPRFHPGVSQLNSEVTYLVQPHGGSVRKVWASLRESCTPLGLTPEDGGRALLEALESAELRSLLQALDLAARVHSKRVGHLHAHFATSATQVSVLTHLLCGVPFSFTAHAKDIYHRDANSRLLSSALKWARFGVTVTDHNVATLRELSPQAMGKVKRIYNGVDLDALRSGPVASEDPPLILGVGRLVEKKGFRYLIEACRLLREDGARFQCRIIGGGAEKPLLKELVARYGLADTVTLSGPQTQRTVVEAIHRCAILALPCVIADDGNQDALPTVLLEAMSLGKPVVSTDVPGVLEIVDDGTNGLVVSQRDTSQLAEALLRLLKDEALRVQFGKEGRRKAERRFSLRPNAARLAELFRESLARTVEARGMRGAR